MPVPGIFHTVSLPLRRFAGQKLAWPIKDVGSVRTCYLDCATWLQDAGTTLQSVIYLADASVQISDFGYDTKTVWLTMHGGTPGTYPAVAFRLTLANGNVENLNITTPIALLFPAVPDDAVSNGGQVVTANFAPVELSQVPSIPNGAQSNDLLLLLRPGSPVVVGTVPFAAIPSGGGGGGSAAEYVFEQTLPANSWDITHNLNRHPEVSIVTTSGDRVMGGVHYVSPFRLTLSFAYGFAGVAYLH